jgi:flagellar biosynthetic protein FliR
MPVDLLPWLSANAALATLVVARSIGLAWTAPALASPGLEWRFRLILAAVLGLALAPAVRAHADNPVELQLSTLGPSCLAEVLLGAGLGWSAALVVAGARQAGEIVGAQGGFSPSGLFDPESGDELNPIGHLYGLVALAIFVAFDGPLVVVSSLAESFRVIAPGSGVFNAQTAALAFAQVGEALALTLRAAAPAALAIALAGAAIGLLGRTAPSLQLLALAMPVRAALALILVFVGLASLAATLGEAWTAWPGTILRLGGPT